MEKNKEAKEVDLGTGSVGKLLFQLALPAITAQIINVLYNMVDRMYIGHLPGEGANALTGVGVTFPVIMAISAFAALVSMGGAPRASIMLGKGRKDEAENILGNCTTALITVAVVLTAFFLIFGRRILLMFGASGNTIEYGWAYMQIYSLGTIFVQLALGLNAFINAQDMPRQVCTPCSSGPYATSSWTPFSCLCFTWAFGALPWPPSYPRESPLPGLSCS